MTPVPCPDPPTPLFHGTDAVFETGDIILPGREIGRSRGQWVWMEPRAASAGNWAYSTVVESLVAAGEQRPGEHNEDPAARTAVEDRIRVYEVEPVGEVQYARGSYRAKSARVVKEVK